MQNIQHKKESQLAIMRMEMALIFGVNHLECGEAKCWVNLRTENEDKLSWS